MNPKTIAHRREKGLCVKCGKPSDGHVSCPECRAKARAKYAVQIQNRICPICNRPLPEDWYWTLCPKCKEYHKEKMADYAEKKKKDKSKANPNKRGRTKKAAE